MKDQNRFKLSLFTVLLLIVTAGIWVSCKDEEQSSLDEIIAANAKAKRDSIKLVDSLRNVAIAKNRAYYKDSLLLLDSLKQINAAGRVSYAINVVDGSASSFSNGRTQTLLTGASVTVSQFGKTETKSTDATGMAVFSGYFRNSLNVTITKAGYTSANYIVAVKDDNATPNGQPGFVGNIIPLFPTTGANTATISGLVTIETDLTNKTRELAPAGTTVLVGIDATGAGFRTKFLADGLAANLASVLVTDDAGKNTENYFYVGEIKQANYETGVVGSTDAAGLYTVTVPSAFDGLPLNITYSQVAANQKLFETSGVLPGDRTATYRTIFGPGITASTVPAGTPVDISFDAGSGALAAAVVSETNGTVAGIDLTAGGSGYVVAPEVVISSPANGTTATATATITNGAVTGLTITSSGSGYTTAPTVTFRNGGGALATSSLIVNGTVTGVKIVTTGLGYTTAPTVTFSAPADVTGTTATGTATIDGQGRVTGVTITGAGSKYDTPPSVTFSAAPTGGTTATGTTLWSGRSIGSVVLTNGGSNYLSAPTVTIAKPDLASGVQATAIAVYDAATKTVSAIQVTNSGSGYTTANPAITITAAGTGAAAKTFLTGGAVISANITSNGSNYVAAPTVTFSGGSGSGATGTAVLSNGKLVGITITNGGSGYTTGGGEPTITISVGDGASAYATVTDGVITAITVSDGGHGWVGTPKVIIDNAGAATGSGATATATVSGGKITGVTVTSGGNGYIEGNVPGASVDFSPDISAASTITAKPGIKKINDIYYGTGLRKPN